MKNMKEAAEYLLSSAAPSVRQYIRLRSLWKSLMHISLRGKNLDLSEVSMPLGIYSDEIHIGVYSPAVASAIKRFGPVFIKRLKQMGFDVRRIVVKVVRVGEDKEQEENQCEHHFSEEDIKTAEKMFSMIDDGDLRRKLAIIWLKSSVKRGGTGGGTV